MEISKIELLSLILSIDDWHDINIDSIEVSHNPTDGHTEYEFNGFKIVGTHLMKEFEDVSKNIFTPLRKMKDYEIIELFTKTFNEYLSNELFDWKLVGRKK